MNLDEYKIILNEQLVCPLGIGIAQNWSQLGSIFNDLIRFKVSLLVELGVFLGGMSELMLLRTERVTGFDYFGTQLDYEQVDKRLSGHPKIVQGDNFSPRIYDMVSALVRNTQGTSMIYCDGGDKIKEIRMYTSCLKVGDYIRAHDYPGETTPESLDEYVTLFPYMVEIEREKCRELGYTLWKRLS